MASVEATPIVLFPIFFIGEGVVGFLDKKNANAVTPSNTKQVGIIIAIIPPVDNPFDLEGTFFFSIKAVFYPSLKSNKSILLCLV